jgi:NADPH:quinone reductase
VDVGRNMRLNTRYQFVLVYTVGWDRIGAEDINRAIEGGATGKVLLRVGDLE